VESFDQTMRDINDYFDEDCEDKAAQLQHIISQYSKLNK